MRLLRTKDLQLEEFFGSSTPPYAILSHTWSREEISFHDMQSFAEKRSFGLSTPHAHRQPKIKSKGGYAKIASACAQAAKDNHDYIWIDTCCIDKSSSAELSEAINSMFRYYKEAEVCYAYLSDVRLKPEQAGYNCHLADSWCSEMGKSRWWTRGWTLQELLAPEWVIFFTSNWEEIGTKSSHKWLVSEITGIPSEVLQGAPLDSFSVAQRMSWASTRETTREEDKAYSLMGIFNIHMPLLYGEGEFAFIRLQEEIMKRSDDQTIFAWQYPPEHVASVFSSDVVGLLAPSPSAFTNSGNIIRIKNRDARPFLITNRGINLEIRHVICNEDAEKMWIVLDCQDTEYLGDDLCIEVRPSYELPGTAHRVGGGWLTTRTTLRTKSKVLTTKQDSIFLKHYTPTSSTLKVPAISISMF